MAPGSPGPVGMRAGRVPRQRTGRDEAARAALCPTSGMRTESSGHCLTGPGVRWRPSPGPKHPLNGPGHTGNNKRESSVVLALAGPRGLPRPGLKQPGRLPGRVQAQGRTTSARTRAPPGPGEGHTRMHAFGLVDKFPRARVTVRLSKNRSQVSFPARRLYRLRTSESVICRKHTHPTNRTHACHVYEASLDPNGGT
jgi:hypothetical protein